MNCQVVQRRLLSAEAPGQMTGPTAAHLDECPDCREYQRRLVQIEQHVPLFVAPPSSAKEELLARLSAMPGAEAHPAAKAAPTLLPFGKHLSARRLQVGSVVAAAACLGLFFLAWTLMPRPARTVVEAPKPKPDPFLHQLMQRNLRLAKTTTPRETIEGLADLSDDLHAKATPLTEAADADNLQTLAALYRKVVHDGIVERVRHLPPNQKKEFLVGVIARLDLAKTKAEELAKDRPDGLRGPLLNIAGAAREASDELTKVVAADRRQPANAVVLLQEGRP